MVSISVSRARSPSRTLFIERNGERRRDRAKHAVIETRADEDEVLADDGRRGAPLGLHLPRQAHGIAVLRLDLDDDLAVLIGLAAQSHCLGRHAEGSHIGDGLVGRTSVPVIRVLAEKRAGDGCQFFATRPESMS